MIKKLKAILDKEDFDYSQGIVDPYKFHKYFYWFSKAFLIIDDEPIQRKYYIVHTFFIYNTLFCIFLTTISAYNAFKTFDIILMTQVIAYIILFAYTLMILLSQKTNLPSSHSLMKAMRKDFQYICSEGHKYREKFFETQVVTWKLTLACFFFTVAGIFVAFCALLLLVHYLLTHDPNDIDDPGRPLLFPIWFFGIDVSATPYYEFFFSFTTWSILMIGYVYNCAMIMTQTEITWVRQITSQADLIIYAIEDLLDGIHPTNDPAERARFDNIIKRRFRNILARHSDMYSLTEDFAKVYRKFLLFEQKLGGPLLCMCAYVSTELYSAAGELNPVLIILFIATFNVCVIPSYMCTFLGEKVRSIGDACWNTRFWEAGPVVRPYFILIMQRSLRSLPLQAPGFEDVSLQTFSAKMSSAYSMFNMLRQTNIGNIQ